MSSAKWRPFCLAILSRPQCVKSAVFPCNLSPASQQSMPPNNPLSGTSSLLFDPGIILPFVRGCWQAQTVPTSGWMMARERIMAHRHTSGWRWELRGVTPKLHNDSWPLTYRIKIIYVKMFFIFLSFLNIGMVWVVEIIPHGRQGPANPS